MIQFSPGLFDRLTKAVGPVQKGGSGFTVIELLVAVALVGILATVAYPSYQDHVRRTNRSEVQQFMMDVANREEQYLLDVRRYGTCCPPQVTSSDINLTVPERVLRSYDVTVEVSNDSTPPSFTITATPLANTLQTSDGELTLDSRGNKTPEDKWR
jgi:type IV pilus assembly protein PilE